MKTKLVVLFSLLMTIFAVGQNPIDPGAPPAAEAITIYDADADRPAGPGLNEGNMVWKTPATFLTWLDTWADFNALTDALLAKLNAIEANATADQTGAEIKSLYEAEANTNAFTDAEQTKLAGIEANATADQTAGEITTAYNSQVAQVSAGEITAGTETAIRRYSPADVKSFATTHGGGAGSTMAVIGSPTYSTIQEMQDLFHSTGLTSGGTISDAGGGAVDVAAGTGLIRATNSSVAQLLFFNWSQSLGNAIPSNSTRFIGVIYNAGSPIVDVRTTNNYNGQTEFLLGTVTNESGALHITNSPIAVGDHAGQMIYRMDQASGIQRDKVAGGLALGETGTRNVTLSTGAIWDKLNRISITAQDTSVTDSFDRYYRDGVGGWTKQATQTQWNNTQFDNGTGTLATMANNKFSCQYFFVEVDDELVSVFGQSEYASLAEAELDQVPSSLPNRLKYHGLLVGRIIFQKSAATGSVESAFVTSFVASGVDSHADLANLAWTSSGHTGTASTFAAFNGSGVAENRLPASTDISDSTAAGRTLLTAADATAQRTALNVENGADVTDATNVAAAGAIMDSDVSAAEGFLRKTGVGAYEGIKSNLNASVAPTVNEDSGDGYAVGSLWIDTTADLVYQLVDSTVAAAVWKNLSAAGGGNAWSDPVDSDILPDVDSTRDIGATANRFAEAYFDSLFATNVREPIIEDGVNGVQLSLSGDRLFHDTNADGTKDAGEEFIDIAGGGSPSFADVTTGTNTTATMTVGTGASIVPSGSGAITATVYSGSELTDAQVSNTLTSSLFVGSGSTTNAIDLATAEVAGILGAANGGTGSGFTAFSGPTTTTKTFTLPDASATILTTNAAVTDAQVSDTLTSSLFVGSGSTTNAIDLATAEVAGILGAANGGTGNAFAAFSGPTTTTKTYSLPDASTTILTTNAAVTDAQVSDTLTSSLFVGSGSTTTAIDLATAEAAGTLPESKGGTGITSLGTGVATWMGTPSSANFAAAVTGETGTGAVVFATSPTLTTPNLGTPSAATLTNATGLPLTTGVTGTLPVGNIAAVVYQTYDEKHAATHTLSIDSTTGEGYSSVHYVTAAATLTLPAVTDGASFTVITIGAIAVSVDSNASDLIMLDGTALDDGDKITNLSTSGDIAVFTYYDATGWYAATNGWTDGGP